MHVPDLPDSAGDERSQSARLQIAVVSHTHWDREWYHTAERFRQRLVALVDAVLAAPQREGFLLDGQAIVLEDYLRVRPEAQSHLAAALQQGLVEAGPWFVLADNLIPSGEALLRNLEAGRRVLRRMGATPPPVLYCPDTFGHPAAMPVIASGYGFPVAVVWRGAGGGGHPPQDAFLWAAASGERVLVYHLPPDGYEIGSALPAEHDAARARWERLGPLIRARCATGLALLLNGADHHARQPDIATRIAQLSRAADGDVIVEQLSLRTWAERFAQAAQQVDVPSVHGELRDSYGYTWTLAGTLATRAHQKRVNATLERTLRCDVEPWLAMLRLRVGAPGTSDVSGRLTMRQLPVLLHRAWEDLLTTHPHDTLCGCSIDAVARAMSQRQEVVQAQLVGLREAALHELLGYDPVAARAHEVQPVNAPVVLRNRAARVRQGIATVVIRDTVADVPVGPLSADAGSVTARANQRTSVWAEGWVTQELQHAIGYERRESPQHYPDNDLVRRRRMLVWVPPVPALGASVVAMGDPPKGDMPFSTAPWRPVTVHTRPECIEVSNNHLTIIVANVDTAPSVSLHVGQRRIDDLCWLETRHDEGDTYTPAPRGEAERLRAVRAWVRHHGPLRAVMRIAWRAEGATRAIGSVGALRVMTDLEVDTGSSVLRCRIRGINRRTNHRLQWVWRTDVLSPRVMADAAFGPVAREPITPPVHTRESVPPGMPLHRWLCAADRDRAATLISDGLAEGEVAPHRLAVTLLRATGELSRNDLPERPGHAGWPAATPEAQTLGAFRATLGLMLHEASPRGALDAAALQRITHAVEDELTPLVGESWRDLLQSSMVLPGVALHGAGLEASAITLAETDPEAIVLRAVNLVDDAVSGWWAMPDAGPWDVTPCRLDETAMGPDARCGETIPLRCSAREVVTLRVRRARV